MRSWNQMPAAENTKVIPTYAPKMASASKRNVYWPAKSKTPIAMYEAPETAVLLTIIGRETKHPTIPRAMESPKPTLALYLSLPGIRGKTKLTKT